MSRKPAMTRLLITAAVVTAIMLPVPAAAQSATAIASLAEAPLGETTRLFEARDPIELTIRGDLRPILRDKSDDPPWRDARIAYVAAGDTIDLPVRLRTRGRFRLNHCSFPPLRFNFVKDSVRGTLFDDQDKPKLGTHCRDGDEYEQYAVQEYLLYRIYEILSPFSFQARLARITYVDTAGNMRPVTRWAILMEEPDELAKRLGGTENEQPGVDQIAVDPNVIILVGLFQYMIGNTDWSIPALHNIVIVEREGALPLAVPYDFDWSGALATRYARPNPQLGIRSVTQRVWRTLCPDPATLPPFIAHFNAKRPEIEALYRDFAPLDPRQARRVLDYFGDFYDTINDSRRLQTAFAAVCR